MPQITEGRSTKQNITTVLLASACIPLTAVAALLGLAIFSGGSAGGTLPSGRSVMTYSDSITLRSTFSSDTATIETAGKTIVVEPRQLIVDGNTVAQINEEVSNVDVHVKRGLVEFVADGQLVPTVPN